MQVIVNRHLFALVGGGRRIKSVFSKVLLDCYLEGETAIFFSNLGVFGGVIAEIMSFGGIGGVFGEMGGWEGLFRCVCFNLRSFHPIQRPILDGFRHMVGLDDFFPGHVGDGAGNF